MTIDISASVIQLLAQNRGPKLSDLDARVPPNYGVIAFLDGSVLDVTLTFRAGSAYCCMESGCHLALSEGRRWTQLREIVASGGVFVPSQLELRLTYIVEEGALFFDLTRQDQTRPGRYALRAESAFRYEVTEKEVAESELG